MTLRAIKTPIFKSADPDFNHRAAQAAYDLVMKMDEDEARMFTSIVVADMTEEIIEKNLRTVQAHVDKIVAKRIADVKKALIRKAAGNPEAVGFAKALVEIEKARQDRPWDENKYRRDQGGRFATKVSHSQTKPIHEKTAASMGIPAPKQNLTRAQQAQFQDEYRQLAAFLGSVHQSSQNPGDTDVFLHFRDKRTGQQYVERASGTKPKASMLDPQNVSLERVEARPNAINVGGAAFGLTQSLGADGVRNVNALTDQGNIRQFSDDWMREDTYNSNVRTYGRIKAGSEYLGQVAPAGSKLQMATSFGEFVGNMGPEAERVMGPTARKTAYRYRGTEKTPDKALVSVYGRAIQGAKMRSANEAPVSTGGRANLKRDNTKSPSQMALQRVSAERRAPTFEERADGRAVIQTYLKQKMPNRRLYELQLASGNTPPSQGVLLNKDGQIVAEAVGYGDDHYIPFNLKNLKSLKGGEYIRTRSVGGLTSEDVYVGLMSGAKQVTVVSRSGTFTMTFEDDFRGGRRHNDKARRMTRRYEQILDAVQSEQIDRGQVDERIVGIIEADVEKDLGEFANYRTKREEVKRRIKAYKEDPELTPEDEMLIRELSNRARADGTSPDAKDYRRQITGRILAQKQTRYRLDGPGYEAALEALEEQFPYYITVKSNPEDAQDVASYERDRGYVEPGRNRPTAARAGLYGTGANPGQKFSASQADFQSGRAPSRAGGAPAQAQATAGAAATTTAAPAAAAEEKKPDTKTPPPTFPMAAMAVSDRLKEVLDVSGLDSEDTKVMSYTADDLRDPVKADKFNTLATQLVEQTPNGIGETWTKYQEATGQFGKKPYDKSLRGMWSNIPFAFSGPAYEGNDINAKRQELARIDSAVPGSVYANKRYSEMTEQEMSREHSGLLQFFNTVGALETPDPVVVANALRSAGMNPESPGARSLINGSDSSKLAGKYLDELHKAQAVKAGVAPEALAPPKPVIHTGDPTKQAPSNNSTEYEAGLLRYAADKLSERGDYEREAVLLEAAEDLTEVPSQNSADVRRHHQALLQAAMKEYGSEYYEKTLKKDADA